ncbi:MAG: hypothetical protein ABI770_02475 [Sphingomicrobium sp.]
MMDAPEIDLEINTDGDWRMSRRHLLQIGALTTAGSFATRAIARGGGPRAPEALGEFGYGAVSMASDAHEAQLRNTQAVLMSLSDDSLLMPFRQMAGLPAPGVELGGWYAYRPDYDYRKNFDEGFAPGCHFGQWVSALARAKRPCQQLRVKRSSSVLQCLEVRRRGRLGMTAACPSRTDSRTSLHPLMSDFDPFLPLARASETVGY